MGYRAIVKRLLGCALVSLGMTCSPSLKAPDYVHEFRRFTVIVDDNLPKEWIQKGLSDWSRVTGDVFIVHEESHDSVFLLQFNMALPNTLVMIDATDTQGEVCGKEEYIACYTHARGVAYFYPAKILKDHNGGDKNNGSWGRVVAHEVGHFLGLEHAAKGKSVMYPTTDLCQERPTEGDGRLVGKLRDSGRLATHTPQL